MIKPDDKQPNDAITDMAGPETNRTNLKYNVPLPVEGAPVYFGGMVYAQRHRQGFSHQEALEAQALALRSFDPASAGNGRTANWEQELPVRNQQGFTDELAGISTSAIISDPTLGNKDRNRKKPGTFGSKGFAVTRLMLKLNKISSEE